MKNWEGLLGVSYGIGINSTAMLAGMAERGIQPDYIIGADTAGNDPLRRGEKPETYHFLDVIMRSWIEAHFKCGFTLVAHWRDSLRASCYRNHTLPSKAYGFPGCSTKFKHQIMERWEKQTYGPDQVITKAIGYHADEDRGSGITEKGRYRYHYFLKDWEWGVRCAQVRRCNPAVPIPTLSGSTCNGNALSP